MSVTLMQLRTKASEYCEPEYSMPWMGVGMSYFVHTKDNRFIVVDGGYGEDAEHLVEAMKKQSGSDKAVVSMWIITHSCCDHWGALEELSKSAELSACVTVEKVCHQLPETGLLPRSGMSIAGDLKRIQESIQRLGASVATPHTNTYWEINGVGIRFFSTPEDFYEKLTNPNELSLVFQIIGPNKKVMFTGDAYDRNLNATTYIYWDELKSDICQIAHHGLNGGHIGFYQKVNAPLILIPTSVTYDRYAHELRCGYCPSLYAERIAERAVKAFEGDTAFVI